MDNILNNNEKVKQKEQVGSEKSYVIHNLNTDTKSFFLSYNYENLLKGLDEEQRKAVIESEGRSLVIAGPGSGKTRVITYKIAYLLMNGVKPEEILLMTFTKAAAKEMIERAQIATKRDLSNMLAGTFHHVCNILLRRYGSRIGLNSNFTILDEDDARDLMKIVRSRYVTSKQMNKAMPTANELLSLYSYMVNTLQTPYQVVLKKSKRWIQVVDIIERIFQDYAVEKTRQNVVDYDDLLIKTLTLLEMNEMKNEISKKYKWILVDEFQDTNILQLQIVEHISQVHGNLFVVADDAQSIYSFRGARFENTRDIMRDAKVFKIQTNYRSTDKIVELVNHMIPKNSVPKKLRAVRHSTQKPVVVNTYDHFDEAAFVAQRITELINEGYDYKDIAVLYRVHAHSLELQVELSKKGIPFRILSGLRFTETAHVKDVIAFLKILTNPYDKISWIRVLKLLDNVGDVTALKIIDSLTKERYSSNWSKKVENKEELKSPLDLFLETNVKSSNIEQFKEAIITSIEKSPEEQIKNFYTLFYREVLEYTYPDYFDREEDIKRFAEMAGFYNSTEEFLNEILISEVSKDVVLEGQISQVTLTTVHQAKGLEWRVVFVIGVNPGDFPHFLSFKDETIDEEERLFYVAITRAKDLLYITHSVFPRNNFKIRDSTQKYRDFIEEIPPHLVEFWRVR